MSQKLLATEWILAEGIIFWRTKRNEKHAPLPGQLLSASVVFLGLGVISEVSPAVSNVASVFGAGLVIAAFMNIFPNVKTDKSGKAVYSSTPVQPKPKKG